jgi:Flp pilus assembly protein TadD
LGQLWLAQGKNDEAAKEFTAVLQKAPEDSQAHYQLALALTGQGKSREAAQHYRRGLKSFENIPVGLNNLAWILATYPDPQVRNGGEAVTLAEKACNLTDYKEAVFVGTLAAAYAEVGRFADAIATAEKARALAEAAGAKSLAENNVKLMELYRAGKPFREVP